MEKLKKYQGMTIVEIMVVCGIVALIFGILMNFFKMGFHSASKASNAVDSIQEMSMVLLHLRQDLRTVTEDQPALPITIKKKNGKF